MNINATIFVEGDADRYFINACLKHLGISEVDIKNVIRITNGWGGLKKVAGELKKTRDEGKKCLVIFDADNDCEGRRKEILAIESELNLVKFDIFLFPDNKSAGDLESLLKEIICDENKPFLDCWEKYEECLKQKNEKLGRELCLNKRKSMIYCHLESLGGKAKEKDRDYHDANFWNLGSAVLEPLKAFLRENIVQAEE